MDFQKTVDKSPSCAIISKLFAAIAQSVERILGKDEVASSNLASSSKFSPYQYDAEIFCYFRIAGGLIRFFNREVGGFPAGVCPLGHGCQFESG